MKKYFTLAAVLGSFSLFSPSFAFADDIEVDLDEYTPFATCHLEEANAAIQKLSVVLSRHENSLWQIATLSRVDSEGENIEIVGMGLGTITNTLEKDSGKIYYRHTYLNEEESFGLTFRYEYKGKDMDHPEEVIGQLFPETVERITDGKMSDPLDLNCTLD